MARSEQLREALGEIDRAIASTLQTDEVLQRALDAGVRALGMDRGTIEVREEETWRLRYQVGFPPEVVGLRFSNADAPIAAAAARAGQPFTIANVAEHDELRRGFFSVHPLTSVVVVPLIVKGMVTGCMTLATAENVREFTESDVEFAQKLAASLSLALENARLYEASLSAQRLAEAELGVTRLLLEAAETLSSSMDVDTVLEGITRVVIEATGRHRVIVLLYDQERDELQVQSGEMAGPFQRGSRFMLSELPPHVRQSLLEKRSVVVEYESPDMPEVPRRRAEAIESRLALFVPLVHQGRAIGQVRIDEPGSRRPFAPREISVAEAIAAQAAVAVENARLYAAEQLHARVAEALTKIDNGLHSSSDHHEMMQKAVTEGAVALGADTGALTMYRQQAFAVQFAYGFPEDIRGTVIPEAHERHSLLAVTTQRPVVVEDAAADPRVDSEHLLSYGVAAVIVVPLVIADNAVGAIYFNFARPRRFIEAEVDFARRLGASLSLAMENARLLEVERSSARLNDALARIDQSIHATLERDEILQRVAVESAGAIGADSTVLCLLEGELWVVRYAYNLARDVIGQGFTVEQAPFMGIAAETRLPVAIDDAYNDSRAVRETQEWLGVRAVLMTSLIVREEVIGGLFFNYTRTHHFTLQETVYASRLASSVGLAIANGRLYEAERDIADRLQEALLTMPVDIPGIEFAHRYHSATEATRVGGDFYDLFELSHNRIGITIGDVAGKGLDAAVLTSLAKNTIRAHATERGKTPADVLSLTNEVIFRGTPTDAFVTLFFGVLDSQEGRLVYSNAGHPPPVVLRDLGPVAELMTTGPPLGALTQSVYRQSEVSLNPGDRLFLYTDGVTEARRNGDFYGTERMFASMTSVKDATVQGVIEQIMGDVLAFTGNNLRDDVALLAVRLVEGGDAAGVQETLGF